MASLATPGTGSLHRSLGDIRPHLISKHQWIGPSFPAGHLPSFNKSLYKLEDAMVIRVESDLLISLYSKKRESNGETWTDFV